MIEKYLIVLQEKRLLGKKIKNSLLFLTRLLGQYYGKTVILLIDEYDVPLAKASDKGYYEEMLYVIRGILQALKDNSFLHLAVVTGCLRIAKESILREQITLLQIQYRIIVWMNFLALRRKK